MLEYVFTKTHDLKFFDLSNSGHDPLGADQIGQLYRWTYKWTDDGHNGNVELQEALNGAAGCEGQLPQAHLQPQAVVGADETRQRPGSLAHDHPVEK